MKNFSLFSSELYILRTPLPLRGFLWRIFFKFKIPYLPSNEILSKSIPEVKSSQNLRGSYLLKGGFIGTYISRQSCIVLCILPPFYIHPLHKSVNKFKKKIRQSLSFICPLMHFQWIFLGTSNS